MLQPKDVRQEIFCYLFTLKYALEDAKSYLKQKKKVFQQSTYLNQS